MIEHRIAVRVVAAGVVEQVLVADLDHRHGQRRRMSVERALGAPKRVGGPDRVLDLVERALDDRRELVLGHHLAVECIAGIDAEQHLSVHLLGQLEPLQQAHAVVGPVAPRAVVVTGAILDRPDRALPLEAGGERLALQVVAARDAEVAGVQGGDLLHQIDPEAVGGVVVSRPEQRHDREPERAARVPRIAGSDRERVVQRRRDIARRADRRRVPGPMVGDDADRGKRPRRARQQAAQQNRQRARSRPAAAREERHTVRGGRTDGDPPVAVIGHAGAGAGGDVPDRQLEADRIGAVQRVSRRCVQADAVSRSLGVVRRPVHRRAGVLLEIAVADQFAIQPAVAGMVDLFHERAELSRVDRRAGREPHRPSATRSRRRRMKPPDRRAARRRRATSQSADATRSACPGCTHLARVGGSSASPPRGTRTHRAPILVRKCHLGPASLHPRRTRLQPSTDAVNC